MLSRSSHLAFTEIRLLTKGLKGGDEAAYRYFVEVYSTRLLRYLLVVVKGDEELAREITQLTFIRVVKYVKIFEHEAEFWRWLVRLARSAYLDRLRKESRRWSIRFLGLGDVDALAEPVWPEAANGLVDEALELSLKTLAPPELSLVTAKYLDGQSYRQLAQAMGTTEKAVESRLVRVRKKLKQFIEEYCRNEGR